VSTGLIVPQKEHSEVLHFSQARMVRMRHKASSFFAISVFISVMCGADPEPKIDEGDVKMLTPATALPASRLLHFDLRAALTGSRCSVYLISYYKSTNTDSEYSAGQKQTSGGEQVAEERERERERDTEDPRDSLSQVADAAHLVNKKLLEYAR
jgi:hypothetical protein